MRKTIKLALGFLLSFTLSLALLLTLSASKGSHAISIANRDTDSRSRQVLAQKNNCSPAYPDVCIPPPPPDLNCPEISYRKFRVFSPDPHHFDGNNNGIGCEGD